MPRIIGVGILIFTIFVCLLNCSLPYTMHITAIPSDTYGIYVDSVNCGTIPFTGDTVIKTNKLSLLKSHTLELKKDESYARLIFNRFDSLSGMTSINVFSVKAKKQADYDVTFLFNPCNAPRQLTERDIKIDNPYNVFKFNKKFNSPNIVFGILGKDTNNYSYFGLKRHVNRYIQDSNIAWVAADSNLQKAILDTSAAPSLNTLPEPVWQEANRQNIDYLIIFFGYSLNFSKGFTPADVATSAAISALGVVTFVSMGFGVFAIPNSQYTIANPIIFCKVYSVNPNVCIFNGKETISAYNDETVVLVRKILSNLIKRIEVVVK